jgi:acyl-CoA synthetase (AMP-forming)/AMP-acid ligase II/acyl carrier protein
MSPGILTACSALSEQARRNPGREAVTAGAESITFGELDRRVRALAAQVIAARHGLPEHALVPTQFDGWSGSILPVVVNRSIGSVVAFHAALRIGVPFCPIDPATPRTRLLEILERIGRPALAVAGSPALATVLPEGVRVLGEHTIDSEGSALDGDDSVEVDESGPGYIIFTSGSTGRPKAVVRRWASFNRFATVPDRAPGVADDATWQVAVPQPLHFGGSHRALSQLAFGNTVHLVDPSTMTTESLVEWFEQRGIQEVSLSDTLAQSISRDVSVPHRLASIVTIRMGSEATNWDTVALLRRLASPSVTIRVGYAASEVSRSFEYIVGPDEPIGSGRVPLGRPTDLTAVRLEPVDDDSPFRQIVVTDASAFGYLDDPELNAARFSRDERDRSWWRSGDLAEIDEHGIWHHRGRVDDLLKINGLLVAPQEAEYSLRALPGIAAAAVLPHTGENGHTRLVAHLVLEDSAEGRALTPESVRAALQERLPSHLIPRILVRHDSLPFGERLKLDRPALRAAPIVRWRTVPKRAATDETVLWLVGRLSELLAMDDILPDENFWDLGLDSLAAVELCALIADAGFASIDPPELLTHRTATLLAARLHVDGARPRSCVVEFNDGGSLPPLFFIPGGGGTALAFRSIADRLGPDQPLVVIEPRGLHQPRRPDSSVETAAASALAEIDARLGEGQTCTLVGYSAGGTIAYEIAQQLAHVRRPVRLLLLDAAPGRRTGSPAAQPSGQDPTEPTALDRLLRRGPRRLVLELPALTARWFSRAVDPAWRLLWLRSSGRPWGGRYNKTHYDVFARLTLRSIDRYRVLPSLVPGVLIEVADSAASGRCRPHFGELTIHKVPGDHLSMLLPPHVSALADVVRSAVSQ